ncbi:Uma2 family endonuclease [Cohnella fermenti]|nr:Uma2 family endonuclease [Cohnella fermenti]
MAENSSKSKSQEKVKEHSARYLIDERYEIIGGVRYDFMTSPKVSHQEILGQLYLAFNYSCRAEGRIFVAPLDVHLDEDNVFQPDLIYISKANDGIIRDGYVYGAPDLVVEILSDSTGRRDKTIKKDTYERFGVGEYWLVDPVYRLVEQFVRLDGRYVLSSTLTENDTIASPTIPCLSIELAAIFPEENS